MVPAGQRADPLAESNLPTDTFTRAGFLGAFPPPEGPRLNSRNHLWTTRDFLSAAASKDLYRHKTACQGANQEKRLFSDSRRNLIGLSYGSLASEYV